MDGTEIFQGNLLRFKALSREKDAYLECEIDGGEDDVFALGDGDGVASYDKDIINETISIVEQAVQCFDFAKENVDGNVYGLALANF